MSVKHNLIYIFYFIIRGVIFRLMSAYKTQLGLISLHPGDFIAINCRT